MPIMDLDHHEDGGSAPNGLYHFLYTQGLSRKQFVHTVKEDAYVLAEVEIDVSLSEYIKGAYIQVNKAYYYQELSSFRAIAHLSLTLANDRVVCFLYDCSGAGDVLVEVGCDALAKGLIKGCIDGAFYQYVKPVLAEYAESIMRANQHLLAMESEVYGSKRFCRFQELSTQLAADLDKQERLIKGGSDAIRKRLDAFTYQVKVVKSLAALAPRSKDKKKGKKKAKHIAIEAPAASIQGEIEGLFQKLDRCKKRGDCKVFQAQIVSRFLACVINGFSLPRELYGKCKAIAQQVNSYPDEVFGYVLRGDAEGVKALADHVDGIALLTEFMRRFTKVAWQAQVNAVHSLAIWKEESPKDLMWTVIQCVWVEVIDDAPLVRSVSDFLSYARTQEPSEEGRQGLVEAAMIWFEKIDQGRGVEVYGDQLFLTESLWVRQGFKDLALRYMRLFGACEFTYVQHCCVAMSASRRLSKKSKVEIIAPWWSTMSLGVALLESGDNLDKMLGVIPVMRLADAFVGLGYLQDNRFAWGYYDIEEKRPEFKISCCTRKQQAQYSLLVGCVLKKIQEASYQELCHVYCQLSMISESHLFKEGSKENSVYQATKVLLSMKMMEMVLMDSTIEGSVEFVEELKRFIIGTLYREFSSVFKVNAVQLIEGFQKRLLDVIELFDPDKVKPWTKIVITQLDKLLLPSPDDEDFVEVEMPVQQGGAAATPILNAALSLFTRSREQEVEVVTEVVDDAVVISKPK